MFGESCERKNTANEIFGFLTPTAGEVAILWMGQFLHVSIFTINCSAKHGHSGQMKSQECCQRSDRELNPAPRD